LNSNLESSTKENVIRENPMKVVRLKKVVLNIGVGQSGEPVERAKQLLEDFTGQKAKTTFAKKTIRDFGIHKGERIGVLVTLRGKKAYEKLTNLIAAKEMNLKPSSFDENGNCSFGIKQNIDIPNVKYKPEIGIFGINISVVLERLGSRIETRKKSAKRIGKNHRINKTDSINFFTSMFGVKVINP
jgi:large subunit ribosomal protein L5